MSLLQNPFRPISMMHRWRFTANFAFISAVALGAMGYLAMQDINDQREQIALIKSEQAGLKQMRSLQEILKYSQQLRGASVRVAVQAPGAVEQRLGIIQQLTQACTEAETLLTGYKPAWDDFNRRRDAYVSLTPADSAAAIKQGTELVKSVFILQREVVEGSSLILDSDASSYFMIVAACVKAPLLAEQLGILRATTIRAAKAPNLSGDLVIALAKPRALEEQVRGDLRAALKSALAQNRKLHVGTQLNEAELLGRFDEICTSGIDPALAVTDSLIAGDKASDDVIWAVYTDKAINPLLAFTSDKLYSGLETLLKNRHESLRHKLFGVEAAAALVFLFVLYLQTCFILASRSLIAALKASSQQAEKANVAKSAFVAAMSHEIRTPLNAVLGYAQLLGDDANLNQLQQHNVDGISAAGNHLLGLVNEILEISSIEAGVVNLHCEVMSCAELLNEVRAVFSAKSLKSGVALEFSLSAADIHLRLDAGKMRQILLNLVGNALKFTVAGRVTCSLREIAAKAPGHCRIQISVSDTGVGIPAEFQPRIFGRFAQTEEGRRYGGTGLGLALSREYARMMGGDISFVSQEGQGSTFTVEVEGEAGSVGDNAVKLGLPHLVEGQHLKLLIIDDIQVNRYILSDVGCHLGLECRLADGVDSGLAALAEGRPDFVLLDWVMPEGGGERFLAQRGNTKAVIIGCSANVNSQEIELMREKGCDEILPKPVRIRELALLLAQHGAKFEYRQVTKPAPQRSLPRLPESLRQRILLALRLGSTSKLRGLVTEIEAEHPDWSQRLQEACMSLDFAALQAEIET